MKNTPSEEQTDQRCEKRKNHPPSEEIQTLTEKEMDQRCENRKNMQYCENISKTGWQDRYLSFNPETTIKDLLEIHTYQLCQSLKVEEGEEEGVEMTEKELDALQKLSDKALEKLEEHRNRNNLDNPKSTKNTENPKSNKNTENPKSNKNTERKNKNNATTARAAKTKNTWERFEKGERSFLPAADYYTWCENNDVRRLELHVQFRTSSTGEIIYKKCVKTKNDEHRWEIYDGDTTKWMKGNEYY